MVKFRSWLLKNWSSASWSICLCNRFIFSVYVYKIFSQVTVFLGEILTFSCNHFSAILPLPWDLNTTLVITFTFASRYLVEWYQGFSNYLWRNKDNFTKSLSKLFSWHNKWRLFKSNTYAKNFIFIPQQLLIRPQPYLLMHLTTVILIIMVSFLTLLSYYLKVYLVFKKSTKQTKSILVAVQDLKIFGITVSEHIKPVYSTQFHLPKNQNYQSWWTYIIV